MRRCGLLFPTVLAVLAGCSNGGGGGFPGDEALSAVGGNGQRAPTGTTLPVPFTVRLVDDDGAPVAGAEVHWEVESGGGTLAAAAAETGADGRATALLTLGQGGGDAVVQARAQGASVRFTASAITGGPGVPVASVAIPPDYGIHDTFVRDGIAFVFAWHTGVIIYDVGNGIRGGSPSRPVEVSRLVPPIGAVSGVRGFIHNGWWFHDPVSGDQRYLFVGQEAPGVIGSSSRGDIYVLDVADLAHPVVVAQLGIEGSGTHNFWVDEPAQVLYAAHYNGGVIAVDVSGTLSGDLSSRVLGQVLPGGAGTTYVWGVQVANGSLYASDMLSGLWQLSLAGQGLGVLGGGNQVPERYTSDLWVRGTFAYTGTWGGAARRDSLDELHAGDVLKIWSLDAGGAPVLMNEVAVAGVQTVSDVEVSADGSLLVATLERGGGAAGFAAYSLANPVVPRLVGGAVVESGLHTGTLGYIGGRTFLFAARNPPDPALLVYDLTALQGLP